jgi:uncharacterized protein YukE
MKLDVNYDELKELSTYVNNKYEEIDKTLHEIKDLINDVDENWKGNDATVFVAKARYYVDKEIATNAKVKDVSTILSTVSGKYENSDKDFYEKMKKESVRDVK